MIPCTVGLMAYNEALNIRHALHALLVQELQQVEVVEILVMASGCTDDTVELAEDIARSHPIVRVVAEAERTGKAAAIKQLMRVARGEVIVMAGADTLLAPTAVEQLVVPFSDAAVGMTGARVVPLNLPTSWLGFAVQMLWHVHHHLALKRPKLGELVAFRNVIDDFPENTSTDEPAIEALVARKGYRLVYAPNAVVYNRGAERAGEFLVQRRRVFAGQVRIAMRYGYFTSSLSARLVLPLVIEAIRSYPRFLVWICMAMCVEGWARWLGLMDAVRGREDAVWRMVPTTKAVALRGAAEPLTLIAVNWPPGTLDAMSFLKDLRRHSEPAGSVFWWDVTKGEILLFVGGESPLEWFQERMAPLTRDHVRPRPVYSNSASRVSVSWVKPVMADRQLVSYRMVKFTLPALK
jgi:biofilm PGA synthesis N-glycosyltransferase PgaC